MSKPETTEVQTCTMPDTDASKYAGVSTSFLRKARMDGDRTGYTPGPPFIKFGRAVRYLKADLDAWIAANRHDGRAA